MDATPMIHLDRVTKVYPRTAVPAVEELTLDVHKGEILILVGPSGCGKSTTLRLINRMIEPSGGHIYFEGEDVTDVNADRLRRRIGYVIQQIGLFPHHTIAENIATVPKMLGWDKSRVNTRVDELLDLMGLEPTEYRDRYPKELSGGQAQRVGVARALGAVPAVMLIDEPFGAIDPITRDRLQNEFLRLQGELHKTIVFVTHDIDEAIKMGDRIAILGERSARIRSGVSIWRMALRSPRMAIRSPILIASSMSWVTKTIVLPSLPCRRRSSFCSRSRVIGSMAPNGSSISITAGSAPRARATPTRCACPPDSSLG